MQRPLLTRVRARDAAALEAFFDAHFDRVHSLIHRLVGDRAVAQDLTQDAFLKIHRAIHTLDVERDPWPWVAQIASNVCRDHWSAAATRHGRTAVSLDDDPAVLNVVRRPASTPEELAAARQEEALVQDALDRLPPSGREVVLLHDYQGLSHDEIATITGRTHAAVRQQYRRALGTLGRLLRAVLT